MTGTLGNRAEALHRKAGAFAMRGRTDVLCGRTMVASGESTLCGRVALCGGTVDERAASLCRRAGAAGTLCVRAVKTDVVYMCHVQRL